MISSHKNNIDPMDLKKNKKASFMKSFIGVMNSAKYCKLESCK